MIIDFFEEDLVYINRKNKNKCLLILFLADMRPFVMAENWFWWGFGPLYL